MESGYDECIKGFETHKKFTTNGVEYWMGRDMMTLLGYASWDKFESVIERARNAARSAKAPVDNHFSLTGNMVLIGSGAEREKRDWYLSRYACYLLAMNADPSKPVVGFAMTYFAVKARKQEIEEQRQLTEEEKRLELRIRTIDNVKRLMGAAKKAGVIRYGLFHDAGYRGFYGDMSIGEVKQRKGISLNEELLDRVGPLELAAHDFRITLTEDRLNRQNVSSEAHAIITHKDVGAEVRSVMQRKDGVRPENLPSAVSIKSLVAKHRKQLKSAQSELQ